MDVPRYRTARRRKACNEIQSKNANKLNQIRSRNREVARPCRDYCRMALEMLYTNQNSACGSEPTSKYSENSLVGRMARRICVLLCTTSACYNAYLCCVLFGCRPKTCTVLRVLPLPTVAAAQETLRPVPHAHQLLPCESSYQDQGSHLYETTSDTISIPVFPIAASLPRRRTVLYIVHPSVLLSSVVPEGGFAIVSFAARERTNQRMTMLEVIEAELSTTEPAIVKTISGRERSSSGEEDINNSDASSDITSPPTTGISTPPAHPVYAATPGGTPNTARTELTVDTLSILPPGSSVLTESTTSSTTTSISNELSNHPPIHGLAYPSIVSMSQHRQQIVQPQLSDDFPVTRPSRESVLKRLSEALLRRSLQKV